MPEIPDIDSAFDLSLKLSRLSVSSDKRALLSRDLRNILAYVDSIESVDTTGVAAMRNPLEITGALTTPLRADSAHKQEALTEQYPHQERDDTSQLYIVPQILTQDD